MGNGGGVGVRVLAQPPAPRSGLSAAPADQRRGRQAVAMALPDRAVGMFEVARETRGIKQRVVCPPFAQPPAQRQQPLAVAASASASASYRLPSG